VTVEGTEVAAIGDGLLVLLGVHTGDTHEDARYLADKIAHLRVFADAGGKMNRSLVETGGAAIVVSQFTLYGDTRRGRRPSFAGAAAPERAEPLVRAAADALRGHGVDVGEGVFGAHMDVELVNDGPVTILLESGGA
jgi:D-tyrosyl-tRNA(Tyr) deacylase